MLTRTFSSTLTVTFKVHNEYQGTQNCSVRDRLHAFLKCKPLSQNQTRPQSDSNITKLNIKKKTKKQIPYNQ